LGAPSYDGIVGRIGGGCGCVAGELVVNLHGMGGGDGVVGGWGGGC
jgi:hypothetical protein